MSLSESESDLELELEELLELLELLELELELDYTLAEMPVWAIALLLSIDPGFWIELVVERRSATL